MERHNYDIEGRRRDVGTVFALFSSLEITKHHTYCIYGFSPLVKILSSLIFVSSCLTLLLWLFYKKSAVFLSASMASACFFVEDIMRAGLFWDRGLHLRALNVGLLTITFYLYWFYLLFNITEPLIEGSEDLDLDILDMLLTAGSARSATSLVFLLLHIVMVDSYCDQGLYLAWMLVTTTSFYFTTYLQEMIQMIRELREEREDLEQRGRK